MKERYFKEYSPILGRDMECKVYGEKGKICYAFPSQDGRFFDYENFGMVEALSLYIESGKIMLVCPDSLDRESWSAFGKDNRERIERQEQYFRYVTLELYPFINRLTGNKRKAVVTGCSMGGIHASIFFFRRPDLYDTLISLSGAYEAHYFFGDYMDDLVYNNSVMTFLHNMPADHPYMKLYEKSRIILCVGRGAWEDELLDSTRKMDALLKDKDIPAWVDYWGYDVSHDWYWWKKQIAYFISRVL